MNKYTLALFGIAVLLGLSLILVNKVSCPEAIEHYEKISKFTSIGDHENATIVARQTYRNAYEEYNISKQNNCGCQEEHKFNLAKAANVFGLVLSLQGNSEALYYVQLAIELDPRNERYLETQKSVIALLS